MTASNDSCQNRQSRSPADYSYYSPTNATVFYDYSDTPSDESESNPMASFNAYSLLLSVVQYVVPLLLITFAYVRMGTRLWLTRTPGAAQVKRDQMILANKKKVKLYVYLY